MEAPRLAVHAVRQRDAPRVAERLPGRAAPAERGHRPHLARRGPRPRRTAGLRAAHLALALTAAVAALRCVPGGSARAVLAEDSLSGAEVRNVEVVTCNIIEHINSQRYILQW